MSDRAGGEYPAHSGLQHGQPPSRHAADKRIIHTAGRPRHVISGPTGLKGYGTGEWHLGKHCISAHLAAKAHDVREHDGRELAGLSGPHTADVLWHGGDYPARGLRLSNRASSE